MHTWILAIALSAVTRAGDTVAPSSGPSASQQASGVCPPFPLRDERGLRIDPAVDTQPYSPRQTCAAEGCHDYERITEGFHFTQGWGEDRPELFEQRYLWGLSPGTYGGPW